jgi:hypothetical protein
MPLSAPFHVILLSTPFILFSMSILLPAELRAKIGYTFHCAAFSTCDWFPPSSKYPLQWSVSKRNLFCSNSLSTLPHTVCSAMKLIIILLKLCRYFAGNYQRRLLLWKYVVFLRVQAHLCNIKSALST